MTPWDELQAELDLWQQAGRRARLWWRDDDATRPGAALDRLIALSANHGAPLALAVVPAPCEAALAERLQAAEGVSVLQHGFAHKNHEAADRKKCELGPARPPAAVLEELAAGRQRLTRLFGARSLPVLVPPWNRIDAALVAALPGLGFRGLSTYTPRAAARPAPGLLQVNCHVDPIRWKPARSFLGVAESLAPLCRHLAEKRQGRADPAEPSGLMTHHAVHDAALWGFLEDLLTRLSRHPAAAFVSAAEAFDLDPDRDVPLSA